jgi:hypothetical protein
MKEAIAETASLGLLRLVVFTGGEPLLRQKDVEESIRFARDKGLWTRIVTNSFWAVSEQKAVDVLSSLKSAGLSEINFSCDDFHQENIPLKNVRHAFRTARDLEIPMLIAHKRIKNEKITINYLSDFLGIPLKEFKPGEKNSRYDVYSSSLTIPIGHGIEWLKEDDFVIYSENRNAWRVPCTAILHSIILSPTKEMRICCGMIDQEVPELVIGTWGSKPLTQIVCEANSDLIANWLALEGPYGMMQFIQEKAPDIPFRDKYVNHCHLCNDIFTRDETRAVLLEHAGEKVEEIALRRGLLEAIRFKEDSCDAALSQEFCST